MGLGGGMMLHCGVPPTEVGHGTVLCRLDILVGERTGELRHVSHFIGEFDVVGDAHFLGHLRPSEGEHVGIGHGRLLQRGSFLGSDHNNAITRTETVDGCGGIFQDGDALDVLRVQLRELEVGVDTFVVVPVGIGTDDTVDDNHRGSVATEAQVGSESTGCTSGLTDEQSRDFALEGGDDIVLLCLGHILRTDGCNGAGQGLLSLGTITYNNGFIELFGVLPERYVQGRTVPDSDFLSDISNEGYHQNGRFVHIGDRRISIQVGHCSISGSLDLNGRSGHWAIGIHYVYFYRLGLSAQPSRES